MVRSGVNAQIKLGGRHLISRGGGGGSGQIIYFNLAQRRPENFKFYYKSHVYIEFTSWSRGDRGTMHIGLSISIVRIFSQVIV